eukprot:4299194-Pyramimonas_sp.AAC.1
MPTNCPITIYADCQQVVNGWHQRRCQRPQGTMIGRWQRIGHLIQRRPGRAGGVKVIKCYSHPDRECIAKTKQSPDISSGNEIASTRCSSWRARRDCSERCTGERQPLTSRSAR